jgi:hypothetical protein
MKPEECKVGLKVDWADGNQYFFGNVKSMMFQMNDHNGLEPSAVVQYKEVVVENHHVEEKDRGEICVPVRTLGLFEG